MDKWCTHYEKKIEWWKNTLSGRWSTIDNARELIKKCLNCDFFKYKNCQDMWKLVWFLEHNKPNEA